jgi:hypothetical protein
MAAAIALLDPSSVLAATFILGAVAALLTLHTLANALEHERDVRTLRRQADALRRQYDERLRSLLNRRAR